MDDEYVEAVLSLVERIPAGQAMAYGAVADVVAERLGRGGPRTVGAVMSAYGGAVPAPEDVETLRKAVALARSA